MEYNIRFYGKDGKEVSGILGLYDEKHTSTFLLSKIMVAYEEFGEDITFTAQRRLDSNKEWEDLKIPVDIMLYTMVELEDKEKSRS
jgi:hypothetical protein